MFLIIQVHPCEDLGCRCGRHTCDWPRSKFLTHLVGSSLFRREEALLYPYRLSASSVKRVPSFNPTETLALGLIIGNFTDNETEACRGYVICSE